MLLTVLMALSFNGIVNDRLQTSVTMSWTQISTAYTYTGPPDVISISSVVNGAYRPELYSVRTVNAATANVAH